VKHVGFRDNPPVLGGAPKEAGILLVLDPYEESISQMIYLLRVQPVAPPRRIESVVAVFPAVQPLLSIAV
jgi:hypothetical protein